MKDLPVAIFDVHRVCNQRCAYCVAGFIKGFGKIIELESINKIQQFFTLHGPFNLVFTGGEPLITPYISEWFRFLADCGHTISIQTNLKAGPEKIVESLPPEKIGWILASFHSVALNELDRYFETARILKSKGYPLVVKILLDKLLAEQFVPIYERLKANDIGVMLSPQICFPENKNAYPIKYTTQQWQSIIPRITLLSTWLYFAGGFKCSGKLCYAGSKQLHFRVFDSSVIRGCAHSFPRPLGNLYENKFKPCSKPVSCGLEQCICDFHYYTGIIAGLDDSGPFKALSQGHIQTVPFSKYQQWIKKAAVEPYIDLEPIIARGPMTGIKPDPRDLSSNKLAQFETAKAHDCIKNSDLMDMKTKTQDAYTNGANQFEFYNFERRLREKWRELPSTRSGREFSSEMLGWSDKQLLSYWEECRRQTTTSELRQWFQELYKNSFSGLEMADIGPGIGVDGIFFAEHGAHITFVDIVEDNLKLLERICKLKGIQADFYFIDNFFEFHFKRKFDVFLCIGSLHHTPFQYMQQQIRAMSKFLKVNGKVLMLAYPKERYIKLGVRDFAEFGKITDGERTPWAEWYDDEKVQALFGTNFKLNWSKNFGKTNIEFNWFELTKICEDNAKKQISSTDSYRRKQPFLSIVVTSRNDEHGGNTLHRTQVFATGLAQQCKQFNLNAELIIVEWNPPADRKRLYEVLEWPDDLGALAVRFIEVPPKIHNSIGNSDKFPLFQMIAKNIGIRRAKGKFVLATNIDILFSDELMQFLSSGLLDENCFYRIDRHDVGCSTIPTNLNIKEQLDFCRNNVIRVQGLYGTKKISEMNTDHFTYTLKDTNLHTNACGDFTLMAKDKWHLFKAYPELPLWSIYVDALLLHMPYVSGMKQVILGEPMRIYHIEHETGWEVISETMKERPSLDFYRDQQPWCRKMIEQGRPITNNDENWGYADKEFEEHIITERPNKQRTNINTNLTIFALPKAFEGHTEIIQRNAIKSWTLLEPRPEIILFGNDKGVAEIARELDLKHIPEVKTNEYGTPLVNDLFEKAGQAASNDILCYINSDIILMSDFMPAVQKCAEKFDEFLMIGQRWDADISEPIDFDDTQWEETLRWFLHQNASLHKVRAIDYFVFSKHLWPKIPPFALGRTAWDNWLVYDALLSCSVINATENTKVIHQNHDYSHVANSRDDAWNGAEAKYNQTLAGKIVLMGLGSIADSTWKLSKHGLVRMLPDKYPKQINNLCSKLAEKNWQNKYRLYRECFDSVRHQRHVATPAISIVVISWRLHFDTIKNFESLAQQNKENFELIFVNNGAAEGEFDCLMPLIDTYVRLNHNTGAYLARNVGSLFAKAPIILFLDDDGIPKENIIQTYLKSFEKYDIIAVRGAIWPKDKDAKPYTDDRYYGSKPFPYVSHQEGNSAYKASCFYRVGGWDDEIIRGGGGLDLSRRLLEIEPDMRKQIYSPEPVLFHDPVENANFLLEKRKIQVASIKRLKQKHPDYDIFLECYKKYSQREDLLIHKNTYKESERDKGESNEHIYPCVDMAKYAAIVRKAKPHAKQVIDLNHKGKRLAEKDDTEGAIKAFEKIIKLNPYFIEAYNNLGVVYHQKGNANKALKCFLTAFKLDPTNRQTTLNICRLYKSLKLFTDAEKLLTGYLHNYPGDVEVYKERVLLTSESKTQNIADTLHTSVAWPEKAMREFTKNRQSKNQCNIVHGALKEASSVHQTHLNNRDTVAMTMGKPETIAVAPDMLQIRLFAEESSNGCIKTRATGTEKSSCVVELKERRHIKPSRYNFANNYRRIYLFHIRKAGGTSLNHMFLSQGGEKGKDVYQRLNEAGNHRVISNNKVFVGWNKGLIEQGLYYYAFSHMPKHQFNLPDKTFTITCLRDPVKRVLSHYKMLLEYKVNNIEHSCMKIEGRWLGDSFNDFLRNIPKEHLLNQLYMFSEDFDANEAFDNIVACSHFFFIEQFSSGVSQLSSKLGLELKPLHIRKTSIDVNFHPADIDRLRSMLEAEYILLDKLRCTMSTNNQQLKTQVICA